MDAFKNMSGDYLKGLSGRCATSKVYSAHQMIGLELATILHDRFHTALYIKLAKTHPDRERLLTLAKDIASRQGVANKGAYFMRLLFDGEQGPTAYGKSKKNLFNRK